VRWEVCDEDEDDTYFANQDLETYPYSYICGCHPLAFLPDVCYSSADDSADG